MSDSLNHVAIIMDGNGRWAKLHGKDRSYGHRQGATTMKNLAVKASELNIKTLSLYAFSTENWKRSEKEVNYLMKLPGLFFDQYLKEIMEANIRVRFIGFISDLPKATQKVVANAISATKNNTGMELVLAVNYGSQQEIVHAIKSYANDVALGYRENDLEVNEFENYLMTKEYSQVDLLIRTSGEYRLSNFLLWQISYAELYFTPTLFPDFDGDQFESAINDYQSRHRRFGGAEWKKEH